MKKLLILSLFLAYDLQASAHHRGKVSSINLGTRFSSVLQKRGVIFYRDLQFDPILAVFLFDDRLEYLGDSVGFRDFIYKDKVRLRSRAVAISDNALFPANKKIIQASPQRRDTYEWSTSLELFFPGYNENYKSELDLTFVKDVSQHHGHYLEALGKVKLGSFEVAKTSVEPNLFSSIGYGDGLHNQYFYGKDVQKSGVNNLALGLWFALPQEADRFYPIVQLSHFQTLGSFRHGTFAEHRSSGFLLSFIATVGLLDN